MIFRKVNSILFLSVILGSSLYAEEQINIDGKIKEELSNKYLEEVRSKAGLKGTKGKDIKESSDHKGSYFDNYMDTVIYNDIFNKKTLKKEIIISVSNGQNGIKLTDNIEEFIALNKKGDKDTLKEEANPLDKTYLVDGYCSVISPAEISKSNEFTSASCVLNFGEGRYRKAEIFIGLYPDYKREMLIGIPIYATFENGNRATVDGILMNAVRSTLDIADEVDTKRIRQLMAETALSVNDTAYTFSMQYLQQLQASQRAVETNFITTGSGVNQQVSPIQSISVQAPKIKDYFTLAGIQFVSQIFSIAGKEYLYNLNPLFTLKKGKKVYIEGVVSADKIKVASILNALKTSKSDESKMSSKKWEEEKQNKVNSYGKTQLQQITVGTGSVQ